MIQIKTAVIERIEVVGMLTLINTVRTAWLRQDGTGVLHGCQADFDMGASIATIAARLFLLLIERQQAFERQRIQYEGKHGNL